MSALVIYCQWLFDGFACDDPNSFRIFRGHDSSFLCKVELALLLFSQNSLNLTQRAIENCEPSITFSLVSAAI